ncbi:hypothetical protein RF007C_12840 [Ruminococcus flavefaciens 007c]|uniref:Uncharacterized protein n=1 Tax=Ruminococcus flavefaciens 007c TaxID=1341157 RepID=W7UVA8_RUMFL|nr:hypothetical protein RF007C_12840 [Ruminococcus flavefaciens 007c]
MKNPPFIHQTVKKRVELLGFMIYDIYNGIFFSDIFSAKEE